jgi:hypothetical protein
LFDVKKQQFAIDLMKQQFPPQPFDLMKQHFAYAPPNHYHQFSLISFSKPLEPSTSTKKTTIILLIVNSNKLNHKDPKK